MFRIAVKLVADLELFAELEVSRHRRGLLCNDPRRRTGHQQADINAQRREENDRVLCPLSFQDDYSSLFRRRLVRRTHAGVAVRLFRFVCLFRKFPLDHRMSDLLRNVETQNHPFTVSFNGSLLH